MQSNEDEDYCQLLFCGKTTTETKKDGRYVKILHEYPLESKGRAASGWIHVPLVSCLEAPNLLELAISLPHTFIIQSHALKISERLCPSDFHYQKKKQTLRQILLALVRVAGISPSL